MIHPRPARVRGAPRSAQRRGLSLPLGADDVMLVSIAAPENGRREGELMSADHDAQHVDRGLPAHLALGVSVSATWCVLARGVRPGGGVRVADLAPAASPASGASNQSFDLATQIARWASSTAWRVVFATWLSPPAAPLALSPACYSSMTALRSSAAEAAFSPLAANSPPTATRPGDAR